MERNITVGVSAEAARAMKKNEDGKYDFIDDYMIGVATHQVLKALLKAELVSEEDILHIYLVGKDEINSLTTTLPLTIVNIYGDSVEPGEINGSLEISNVSRIN